MPINISKFFVKPDDPVLVKVAKKVPVKDISSRVIKKEISQMLLVAYGEKKGADQPIIVGLAAPQIGISRRIILVDVKATGRAGQGGKSDLRVYINPRITWSSPNKVEWYEGCYSTGPVCGIVERPEKIKISALTQEGKQVKEEYSGYTARIFQHEIDHLDGREFVTHITDDSKLHLVEDEDFPAYRNEEGWRDWENKCSREHWNKIKGISEKEAL